MMDHYENIMSVMDSLTPYYKNIMESLPAQQRKVICSVARYIIPINSTLISKESRLDPRIASTALTRLKRKGLLTHNHRLWELSDPWLGVWYRIRTGKCANIPDAPLPVHPDLLDQLLLASVK